MTRYLLFLLVGLVFLSACTFPAWRDQVIADLMAGRLMIDANQVGSPGIAGRTVEFYDAGGRHVGYGVIGSGSADFFNVDGSRAGFGRIGR